MQSLAFNIEISGRLRKKIQFILAIFPVGLMFASFIPTWRFAGWLAGVLDIPMRGAVKDQAHGFLWLVIFLIVMTGLMISGYLLGWAVNAFICQWIFRWPSKKVRSVFLNSEVPSEWLEHDPEKIRAQQKNSWAAVRLKGREHYILHRGILKWGVWMYVFMAIVPAFRGNQSPSLSRLLWQAGLWASGGALFGAITWYFSEWRFQRGKNEKNATM